MGPRARHGATSGSTDQPLILNIFDGESVILGRMARRETSPKWLLLFPVSCLTLVSITAAFTNSFGQEGLEAILCHDLGVYLGTHWSCVQTTVSSLISLLRDVPSLIAILFISLTPRLMYQQWTGIKIFLHNMENKNLLSFPNGRNTVAERIRECNAFFQRASGVNPFAMLAAVTFMLLISGAQQGFGVYVVLSPQHLDGNQFEWWASLSRSQSSLLLYILIGSVGVYTVLLQNIYGGRTVFLIWQLRNDLRYLADPDNLDGNYGWSEIDQILQPTWISLMVHGIALIVVALSLSRVPALYLLPLIGQWLLAAPLYVGIPVHIIRKSIRLFKEAEKQKLNDQYQMTQDLGMKDVIASRIARVREIKVIPFVRSVSTVLVIIGLISSLVTISQLAWLIYFKQ